MLSTKTEAGDIASQAKENGKPAPANFARHEAKNKYHSTYCFVTLQFVLLVCTFLFEIKKVGLKFFEEFLRTYLGCVLKRVRT